MYSIDYEYRMLGHRGLCHGTSVAKAIDNAKLRYLRDVEKIPLSHPSFRIRKSKLTGVDVKLILDKNLVSKYRVLYKAKKDGDLQSHEAPILDQLTKIFRDPRVTYE